MLSSRMMSSKESEECEDFAIDVQGIVNREVICSLRAISLRKVKNVDSGYRLYGDEGCNRVTQTVVITRYFGVMHTERDQCH